MFIYYYQCDNVAFFNDVLRSLDAAATMFWICYFHDSTLVEWQLLTFRCAHGTVQSPSERPQKRIAFLQTVGWPLGGGAETFAKSRVSHNLYSKTDVCPRAGGAGAADWSTFLFLAMMCLTCFILCGVAQQHHLSFHSDRYSFANEFCIAPETQIPVAFSTGNTVCRAFQRSTETLTCL